MRDWPTFTCCIDNMALLILIQARCLTWRVQPGNRFVSFRSLVRACFRAVWRPSGIRSQECPKVLAHLFPFYFLARGAFPFPFSLPPTRQISYPTLVGLFGILRGPFSPLYPRIVSFCCPSAQRQCLAPATRRWHDGGALAPAPGAASASALAPALCAWRLAPRWGRQKAKI